MLSIDTGLELDNSFESFNVDLLAKFIHHLREKGKDEKLTSLAPTSSQVVKQRPHPSINTKLAGPKVCKRKELLSEMSLIELEAVCRTYFIPEVHPDNPEYAPQCAVAMDYSLWLSAGYPAVLRGAYKEMEWPRANRDA